MASLVARARRAAPSSRAERLQQQRAAIFDSEDEADSEAEEQERALSDRFGEAAEGGGEKRTLTDAEIADDYKDVPTKNPKKPRVVLTTEMVTSSKGLIQIPTNFASIKLRPSQRTGKIDISAAAAFSRQLMGAYKQWTTQLFPSMAMEDTLSRVETFGSRREIKSFLKEMRKDACAKYVERVYGKDKAETLLQELEDGLEEEKAQQNPLETQQPAPLTGEDLIEHPSPADTSAPSPQPPPLPDTAVASVTPTQRVNAAPVANPYALQSISVSPSTRHEEASSPASGAPKAARHQGQTTEGTEEYRYGTNIPAAEAASLTRRSSDAALVDTDDEGEAHQNIDTSQPGRSVSKGKPFLDDDSDEEEELVITQGEKKEAETTGSKKDLESKEKSPMIGKVGDGRAPAEAHEPALPISENPGSPVGRSPILKLQDVETSVMDKADDRQAHNERTNMNVKETTGASPSGNATPKGTPSKISTLSDESPSSISHENSELIVEQSQNSAPLTQPNDQHAEMGIIPPQEEVFSQPKSQDSAAGNLSGEGLFTLPSPPNTQGDDDDVSTIVPTQTQMSTIAASADDDDEMTEA